MTPAIAYGLWREQERLERLGWIFPVMWSPAFREYAVHVRQMDGGPARTFRAQTRQELMQDCLRWAALHSLADMASDETRPTIPAPPPAGAE